MTLALVFPGQGSQYVGMGNAYKDHPFFKQADDYFDFSLRELCLNGPEETLKLTPFTQPAIVLHSLILFDLLKKYLDQKHIKIDYLLGHSVGEYAALAAAEVFTLEEVLKAVHIRGKSMQEAVPKGQGGMTAMMKLEASLIEKACDHVSKKTGEIVSIANHNSPVQIVISGHLKACQEVGAYLKSEGHKFRAITLPVSAPFHCQLMKPASITMEKHFKENPLKKNSLPYISNIDAHINEVGVSSSIIAEKLTKQVTGQVRWVDSINKLPAHSKVIEVGPGKVLSGLCRKIRDDIDLLTLDGDNAFNELDSFLNL